MRCVFANATFAGGRATARSHENRSRGDVLSCRVRWHMRGGMRVPFHARAPQQREQRSRFGHWGGLCMRVMIAVVYFKILTRRFPARLLRIPMVHHGVVGKDVKHRTQSKRRYTQNTKIHISAEKLHTDPTRLDWLRVLS